MGTHIVWADTKQVEIKNAWIRATVPGQQVAGAYLEITSAKGGTLVKVETPAANMAEIHSMKVENGIMRMKPIESLTLPAKETIKLSPGGNHLMLTGLKQTLKAGDSVSLQLIFKDGLGFEQIISVNATVKELTN
jgi:copper(I)-binding protein